MRTDIQLMNVLFHAALRRDLGRLTDVLSRGESSAPPYNRQMPALFRWFADKRYGPAYRRRAAVAFANRGRASAPS